MNIRDVALTLAEAVLRSEFSPGTGETPQFPAGRRPERKKPPFTITISREVGALGTTTATEIGKRLGWPVYDQEIINRIAEEMGKSSTHVRGVDERHFTWLEGLLAGLLAEYHVNPTSYMKHLVGTVRGLGVKGNCVIVGRGGNFILPPETTLRVRLVADLKDRIKVIGRRRGVSDREAVRWIEETEKERLRFIRGNFGKDPTDPHHYDLVLNTSRLSPAECADAIIQTMKRIIERPEPIPEETLAPRNAERVEAVAGR